ncbi:hypothetical protein PIB30_086772, partial [Stylosanthes scabra]|nr:hypothetical protein [Stylosanthes scabra]
ASRFFPSSFFWVFSLKGKETLAVTLPSPTAVPLSYPPTLPLKPPPATFSFCVVANSSPLERGVVASSIAVHPLQPLSLLVRLRRTSQHLLVLSVACCPSVVRPCSSQPSLKLHVQR